jgi:hypothetical protein
VDFAGQGSLSSPQQKSPHLKKDMLIYIIADTNNVRQNIVLQVTSKIKKKTKKEKTKQKQPTQGMD